MTAQLTVKTRMKHNTRIEDHAHGPIPEWRAVCSCGWECVYSNDNAAMQSAVAHKLTQAEPATTSATQDGAGERASFADWWREYGMEVFGDTVAGEVAALIWAYAVTPRAQWPTDQQDEQRRQAAEARVLTCAFCGHQYPPGTPPSKHEALTEHIRVCPEHPIGKELRAALAALAALQGEKGA